MDVSQYDEKTAALIQTALQQQQDMDPKIQRALNRLLKKGRELDDDALLGFANFHLANVYYSLEDYEKFRKHLQQAVICLQKANEPELLARAYNFVGIDASNNGSYDVAYYYYILGLRVCEDLPGTHLVGIMNANIGQIHLRLGNEKLAKQHIRWSNRLLHEYSEDPYYFFNMITGYYTEGLLCIRLGDLKGARHAAKKIEYYKKKSGGKGISGVQVPIHLLRTQLALAEGDDALYQDYIDQSIRMLQDAHQLFDYIDDIDFFCRYLIEHDELQPVKRIIDAISPAITASGVTQMMRIVSALEIAYYEKKGNRSQMLKCLSRQHQLATAQALEQNRIYEYSITLIDAMDAVRRDQRKMRAENEALLIQAQTDPLTGVPNRLSMNRMLERAFETAYKNKKSVGIEILDVDAFKEYNDNYGHQEGDVCLQRIAQLLLEISSRPDVHCARYGGDEFVLIYENMTDEEILEIARSLEKRLITMNIRHAFSPVAPYVTISQGVCNAVPHKKSKLWDFLTEADNALYAVKKNAKRAKTRETISLRSLPKNFG